MGNDFLDKYTQKAQSEQNFAPTQAQSAPVQKQSAPVQAQSAPAQVQSAPVQKQSAPAQKQSAPAQKQSAPAQKQSAPVKQNQNNGTQGAQQISAGAQNSFVAKQSVYEQSKISEDDSMNFEEQTGFAPPSSGGGFVQEKKKLPWGYIIIGVIALIAIIVFAILLTRGTALPAMADEGWELNDVQLWADENSVLLRTEEEFSDTIAQNTVISQNPAAGETVGNGEFLQLVVSAGPDLSILVPVPDIMNMTVSEVEAWAAENLMTKVRITTEDSLTIPAGKVIEYTVNDNTVIDTEIRRDTPFYVVFSNGKGEGSAVELPNFITMSVEEAQKFGTDNGIVIQIVEEFSETVAKGQIMEQSIKAEETIHEGDTVKLTISKGKEIRVPNFFAMTKDEAEREAVSLGISISTSEKYMAGVEEGKLISQSMYSGALYEDDDHVELVYSLGDTIYITSMVGSSENGIRDWVLPLNEKGASITVNITYTESDKAKNTVLAQDKVNLTIPINATVHFVVSSGKAIYAPDLVAPESAAYPDVITREQAITICNGLGIVPVFKEISAANREPGEVWQQSIPVGTKMSEGDTITLNVVPGSPTVTVPNYVGMTDSTANALPETSFLKVVYVEVGETDKTKWGTIKSQSVLADSVVTFGTTVTLEKYVDPTTLLPTP